MARIQLTDTNVSIIAKMSDGNPGAMNALLEIIKNGGSIDPDDFMEGLSSVLMLDTLEIYGCDIYVLFSDICEKDVAKTLAVIRAVQFGFFDRSILKEACCRQDRSGKDLVPVENLYQKVKERLPNFDKSQAVTELH